MLSEEMLKQAAEALAHEIHLIEAHTQREEVAGQISLLDFLSVVDCHLNHEKTLPFGFRENKKSGLTEWSKPNCQPSKWYDYSD